LPAENHSFEGENQAFDPENQAKLLETMLETGLSPKSMAGMKVGGRSIDPLADCFRSHAPE
jgi:hypothetical protein